MATFGVKILKLEWDRKNESEPRETSSEVGELIEKTKHQTNVLLSSEDKKQNTQVLLFRFVFSALAALYPSLYLCFSILL